jgi:small-conductance mechanosensitive channel
MRRRNVMLFGLRRLIRALALPAITLAFWTLAALPAAAAAATPPADTAAPAIDARDQVMQIVDDLRHEAETDIGQLPQAPPALDRFWRSLGPDGSDFGGLMAVVWTAVAVVVALLSERATMTGLTFRLRRRLAANAGPPSLGQLVLAPLFGVVSIAVLLTVYSAIQSRLLAAGLTSVSMGIVTMAVLMRWRPAVLVARLVLCPGVPQARLIALGDAEALHLARLFSVQVLLIVGLVGVSRAIGIREADVGAAHVVGLAIGVCTTALLAAAAVTGRPAMEALIRGREGEGVAAAIRAGLARAWVPAALTNIAGLLVLFLFGLSLGLLAYFYAVTSTLGVLMVLLVFEGLTGRSWQESEAAGTIADAGRAVSLSVHHVVRVTALLIAMVVIAKIWIAAMALGEGETHRAAASVIAVAITLFVAYVVWELARLAIDRHLQPAASAGPAGGGDADALPPASRLQTVLPFVRVALSILLGVVAMLVVLSRLGIDTAPLIAGAGVFGLAISFGSQSLVRDIISGLFYMWDDAFRVGEYIDTGRLKGTVEALGLRSVKLRHQNGPLHTIPYGQLGAVSNLSRDFATIKFNLRLETGSDIETVRKTAKQIGLQMQESPEMAAEVMLPLKLQGVADITDNALIMRFKFTARPVKPSWVQREYLKRIYQVFAEKGIAFATGTVFMQTMPPPAELERAMLPAAGGEVVALPAPSRVG